MSFKALLKIVCSGWMGTSQAWCLSYSDNYQGLGGALFASIFLIPYGMTSTLEPALPYAQLIEKWDRNILNKAFQ